MPFGTKPEPMRRYQIDFDDIYERAMKPAFVRLKDKLDYIRADEERTGGVIHLPMFERLLLAEIAVVDVTLPNPNVYYELGIRHGAKPCTTIIVGSIEGALPFDISLARTIPYGLENGVLEDKSAGLFVDSLVASLEYALAHVDGRDSPVFQLIPSLRETNLPHDITESFRDRAREFNDRRERLDAARRLPKARHDEARTAIAQLESEMGEITKANAELFFDILLAYRDVGGYKEMVALADRAPAWLRDSTPMLIEQQAFALNRRNEPGDRDRAIDLLDELLAKRGHSPETSSIAARIHKDKYFEALESGDARRARGSLARAIELYRQGFNADPRDYYPGVNLATLLTLDGSVEAQAERSLVLPALSFALGRLGGLNTTDYWQAATVLELAIVGGDSKTADRALDVIFGLDGIPPWQYATTKNNLELLRDKAPAGAVNNGELLADAIAELAKHSG
jgi:tetratricopeptide (TPR) repeat protein